MSAFSDHSTTHCERPGGCDTWYTLGEVEDYNHRADVMRYFKRLVVTYVTELDSYYTILHGEITSRTEGRQQMRGQALGMEHMDRAYDIECYTLQLEESNIQYHKRLIDSDNKFSGNVMVITDDMNDMSPEEMEVIFEASFTERKQACTTSFREHLGEMKAIREAMRIKWNKVRHGITCFIEEHPVLTPTGSHGMAISLSYELEPLWKE